jgi:hypothetical protein
MNDVVTKVTDSDVQDSANDAGAGNDTIAVQEPAASLSFGAALAAARGALGASPTWPAACDCIRARWQRSKLSN